VDARFPVLKVTSRLHSVPNLVAVPTQRDEIRRGAVERVAVLVVDFEAVDVWVGFEPSTVGAPVR